MWSVENTPSCPQHEADGIRTRGGSLAGTIDTHHKWRGTPLPCERVSSWDGRFTAPAPFAGTHVSLDHGARDGSIHSRLLCSCARLSDVAAMHGWGTRRGNHAMLRATQLDCGAKHCRGSLRHEPPPGNEGAECKHEVSAPNSLRRSSCHPRCYRPRVRTRKPKTLASVNRF